MRSRPIMTFVIIVNALAQIEAGTYESAARTGYTDAARNCNLACAGDASRVASKITIAQTCDCLTKV